MEGWFYVLVLILKKLFANYKNWVKFTKVFHLKNSTTRISEVTAALSLTILNRLFK